MTAPIVVGVDGSVASTTSLDWAAATADQERRGLVVLGAVDPLATNRAPELSLPASVLDAISAEITEIVRQAVTTTRTRYPNLDVEGKVASGSAAAALIDAAGQASLTVVGTRHLSGVKGLFLGSVSTSVAAHAPSPVAVIAGPPGHGPVVVGIDGSPLTERVLHAAYHHAAAHGVDLTVVHTWTDLTSESVRGYDVEEAHAFAASDKAHEMIAQWTEKFAAQFPSVHVEPVVAPDGPVRRILTAAQDPTMIVIGSRGRGGFAGLLLGSTSQAVLQHSTHPTLVIKESTSARR